MTKTHSNLPFCNQCGSLGRVILSNSWMKADGRRFVKCWICNGVGRTAHNDAADRDFVSSQIAKRAELVNANK